VGGGAEAGEGGEIGVEELTKKRFLWGVGLAWAPWIPTLISLGYVFRAIFEQKATGFGAVAGGLTELLVMWGIGTMIISQVAAIVWLCRAFSREHWIRNAVSVLSICLSGLMLVIVCFFLWFAWFQPRRY
jgi:hypothetical protein